jgi:phage terminase large subunit-like protein
MQWQVCTKESLRIEHLVGMKCWVGVDLASQNDMCAIGVVFELPNNVLAIFVSYFIPKGSPTYLDPDMFSTMLAWEEQGYLTATEGAMADFTRIEDAVIEINECFDVQNVTFDPMQSNMIMRSLFEKNVPVGRYPNTASTMTMPTDDFLTRVVAGKLQHNGHPILAWNASNVHGERKGNGTIMPRKDAPNSIRKIDGIVALIMADGVRLNPDVLKTDDKEQTKEMVYEKRGLRGF